MNLYRDNQGTYGLSDCENGEFVDVTTTIDWPFRKYLNPETGEVIDSKKEHEKYLEYLNA